MSKILIGITALALLALHPYPATAKPVSGIAAIVNDEIITTQELDKEYLQLQKEADKAPVSDKSGLRGAALNRLVEKKLIEQKIRELDIKVTDEEVRLAIEDVKKQNNLTQENLEQALAAQGMTFAQYRGQLKEQLERLRLMSQEVRSKVQVGEREMRDYYQANLASYGGSELYSARHIFLKVDKKGGAEELAKAQARAAEVLAKARAGEDFAALAKKYSDDPAAAKDGGDLGTFKRTDMLPEIGDTVAALKPGEVSAVVQSPAGLHIIKLEQKKQEAGRPFEEVKDAIEDVLYKKKSDERFAQWVKELRAGAAIELR
ncbi:Periplasmic chaperone and peptidyl-prolyl cis-trans isomerase of outer membrane proteins SurA [Citrifermentans bremense]|uniref:Periplasmic chaperone and peptidyl-prolyl cis-trans isomerase of outer membrane proteins SurA n=2 Tax=Citrifermentans bremense TaxID=60035 RepID=A0A6S6M1F6_9BACT|nr:Periplasmic chaperone and peptidyl-prolyl cis-trans isomerase of outer membrane proteins SurA [Citrifermentans bremense]